MAELPDDEVQEAVFTACMKVLRSTPFGATIILHYRDGRCFAGGGYVVTEQSESVVRAMCESVAKCIEKNQVTVNDASWSDDP